MADPFASREVSVTIKFPESAKYKNDNPWLVFRGSSASEVAELIADAFDIITPEQYTLAMITLEAQAIASGAGLIAGSLGGRPVPSGDAAGSDDVWVQAKEAMDSPAEAGREQEPEKHPMFGLIERCAEVGQLQKLWAENQKLFADDAEIMEAYKVKGRALSAA